MLLLQWWEDEFAGRNNLTAFAAAVSDYEESAGQDGDYYESLENLRENYYLKLFPNRANEVLPNFAVYAALSGVVLHSSIEEAQLLSSSESIDGEELFVSEEDIHQTMITSRRQTVIGQYQWA